MLGRRPCARAKKTKLSIESTRSAPALTDPSSSASISARRLLDHRAAGGGSIGGGRSSSSIGDDSGLLPQPKPSAPRTSNTSRRESCIDHRLTKRGRFVRSQERKSVSRKLIWRSDRAVRTCHQRAPVSLPSDPVRSEEHTSELQSQSNLVCRLLLEK